MPVPTIRPKAPSDPTYKPKPRQPAGSPGAPPITSSAAPVVSTPAAPAVSDPGTAYSAAPIVAPDPLSGDAYSTVYYSGPSFWSQYSSYFYWAVILYLAYRYRHQLMHLLRAAQ